MVKKNLLFLTPSERTGSTWLLSLLYSHPKVIAKTEPLRQQLPQENPVHPLSGLGRTLSNRQRLIDSSNFANQWWLEFLAWFCSESRTTVIKETNLFFRYSWLVNLLQDHCRILVLNRDVRGIVSSFKRGNLFNRWNYQKVFQYVKDTIVNDEELLADYHLLLKAFDSKNKTSILSFLYALNSNELLKSVKDQFPLFMQYEALRQNPRAELKKILSPLNLSVTQEIEQAIILSNLKRQSGCSGDHDYAITKRSDVDNWQTVLTPRDIKDIHCVIEVAFQSLPQLKSFCDSGWFQPYAKDGLDHRATQPQKKRVGFTDSSKKFLSGRPIEISDMGQSAVVAQIQEALFSFPSRCSGCRVSTTMVTNEQFASFLNWLDKCGVSNFIDYHYFLINCEMLPDRGGRIFQQNVWSKYGVLQGYENHPVNWVYYAGAELFCLWVGGRLLTSQEYDDLEKYCLKKGYLLDKEQNTGNQLGDTRPVIHDGSLFKDLKGNVMTWTSSGDSLSHGFTMRLSKGGAFNAPYRPLGYELMKPVIFSGRDLGIRVASDDFLLSPPEASIFLDMVEKFLSHSLFTNSSKHINNLRGKK